VGQQFVPNETFEAKVNGFTNRYMQGQLYTVYDTADHRDLAKKAQQWLNEGKITIVGVTSGAARPATISSDRGG
jgi:predicted alpha/beta-fold hydrolase